MNLKRILPIEYNLSIKNFLEYFKKSNNFNSFKKNNRIYFFDSPSYGNLGDQAIGLAISRFIIDQFPDYEYIEISENELLRNIKNLKKTVSVNDIICLTGGGNMGDLYPRYEALRRKIIKTFPNNKIIIFPQTIDYTNDLYGKKQLNNSIKTYNSNPNLIICAREERSYNLMSNIYNNVYLVPDIVFYLHSFFSFDEANDKTVGLCLRNDKESLINNEEKDKIKLLISKKHKVAEITTINERQLIQKEEREKIIFAKLCEFKRCNLIITDRLHGMIFSILCGVPCIFLDNSNKKLSGVYKTIKHKITNVIRINKSDIKKLDTYIDKLIEKKCNLDTSGLYDKLLEVMKK